MDSLLNIQNELKAPKSQFNLFGNYKYRNCEDILEALKPLLKKYNAVLFMSDDIVVFGDSLFVKSTATIKNTETEVSVSAFAKHPLQQKGMNDSQITGSASSYARKYALNGLFLIDDTKDSDTTNAHGAVKPEMTPVDSLWSVAVKKLAEGKTTIDAIRKTYLLTDKNEKQLLKEAGKL